MFPYNLRLLTRFRKILRTGQLQDAGYDGLTNSDEQDRFKTILADMNNGNYSPGSKKQLLMQIHLLINIIFSAAMIMMNNKQIH